MTVIAKTIKINPKFQYISQCCQSTAKKDALIKTPEASGSLGKWRCSTCGKKCSVKVSR
jgi:hypothetical protein